jgi:hypothetical protein
LGRSGEVTGWLWEGAAAALIRETIPGSTDADRRRARAYLNAAGLAVNARGQQRGGQPRGVSAPAGTRGGAHRTGHLPATNSGQVTGRSPRLPAPRGPGRWHSGPMSDRANSPAQILEERLRLGAGSGAGDRGHVLEIFSALDRYLAHWNPERAAASRR